MKLRSWLLVACMVVVPAVAMFSHRVPAGVRRAVRQHTWEPVCCLVKAVFGSGEESAPAPALAGGEPVGEPLVGLAVDCRPVEGGGMHVASCRVAIDASGQLHRVFQAAGPTPDEAVAALEQAVSAWQRRLADRAVASPGGL